MAKVAEDLTLEVKAKLTVDRATAEACLKMVDDGVQFKAAISFDSSMEARTAEKQGVTSLYTVTAPLNCKLEYHDTLKRLRDGKVFRVTSDGDDKITPPSASFQFAQVTAEEWVPV